MKSLLLTTRAARVLAAATAQLVAAAAAIAQEPSTVSGHVTARGAPVAGAHVRVDALRIDRTTDGDGRYSFVVPSSRVRGQSVRITATMSDRRTRYEPKTTTIALTGGAITQDFDLAVADETQPLSTSEPRPLPTASRGLYSVDTTGFGELAGPVDLASALAGRVAGLRVSAASEAGGSPLVQFRGPRSVLGSSEPLFVVDGMPLNNTVFASMAQRVGLGGFDYGSPLADLNLSSIASVTLVSGPEAVARFGGRGANGVVVVTTKSGDDGPLFAVSASQQISHETILRVPAVQNQFGQGLNGKFEFFDGKGGGINDAVAQNWGPRLDGSPTAQASYTEAGRPDIRFWSANANNIQNYFESGRTSNSIASLQARGGLGSLRISLGDRDTRGVSPSDHVTRLDGGLNVRLHAGPKLELSANGFGAESKQESAPGTGAGEGNPVFQFMRMGRQVDTDSLRAHLRDASGRQISWNYIDQNNPFFLSLADSNRARRDHVAGDVSATYTLAPGLHATATGGSDYYHEDRFFGIASGWMGGFPFYAGTGDFSKGGFQGDAIAAQRSNGALTIDAIRSFGTATVHLSGGGDFQTALQRVRTAGVDSAVDVPSAGAPQSARVPAPVVWSGNSRVVSAFGQVDAVFSRGVSVGGTLRNAWTSMGDQTSALLPSASARVDLMQAFSAIKDNGLVRSLALRSGVWRDAADQTPYSVETLYWGRSPTGSVAPVGNALLAPGSRLAPETTTGAELGADAITRVLGVELGLTLYDERTSNVILPLVNTTTGVTDAQNAAEISNRGIEGRLSLQLGNGDRGLGWSGTVNVAKNANRVEQLSGGAQTLALGPAQAGLVVQARAGQPLGVLIGERLLRDANSGALILRNGLPLPDSVAGEQQLGVAQPDWDLGVQSTVRYRWISASAQVDGRIGGQIFSLTNLTGTYAGTLATTAFRPDSGLLIGGIDAVTRGPNTTHVSAQDYYHALAAVQEPWVYSATSLRLRELRVAVSVPVGSHVLPFEALTASLVGRNLYLKSNAPNIDPDAVFSPYQLPGVEMGQLPGTRAVGVQLTITP